MVDSTLWSDEPVELAWGWVDDVGDGWDLEDAVGSGPAPTLPIEADRLALIARWEGQEARAELPIDDRPLVRPPLHAASLPWAASTVPSLELEDRRAWTAGDGIDRIEPNGLARITVRQLPDGARSRFMATRGTLFELDAATTDWVAGDLTVDEDVIEVGPPLDDGPVTVLALLLDAAGGFGATDLWVGEPPAGSRVHGRFLPGGLDVPYVGTLAADDESPTGLRVDDARPATDADVWEASTLDCIGVSGPFDPDWLLDQRCSRNGLVGRTVYVEPDP